MTRGLWIGMAALLLLLACGRTHRSGTTRTDTIAATARGDVTAQEAVAGVVAASLRSESHLTAVMHETNAGEIAAGQLALQRATLEEIRRYARRMVDEHTSLDQQLRDVATFSGITLSLPDSTLPHLQREEVAELARQIGGAFDRAYISQQVDAHQRTLALVNAAYRASRNDQLRTMLSTVVEPRIRVHLAEAEELRARVNPR